MNTKTMAILAGVIIVVAAVGCAAYFVLKDDSPDSDYTLLDSDEKIQKGMTIKMNATSSANTMSKTIVVDSVSEGKVNTHVSSNYYDEEYGECELTEFSPSDFDFDYTDDSDKPEEVDVDKDGDKYKISGTDTNAGTTSTTTVTYDMTIEYDGSSVKSVEGKITSEYKYTDSDETESYTSVFSTADSKVKFAFEFKKYVSKEYNLSKFYSEIFTEFDADESGDKAVKSSEKFGNVTADVYTINGTIDTREYKDVKMYVYNGYILKATGTIDDEKQELLYEIYID